MFAAARQVQQRRPSIHKLFFALYPEPSAAEQASHIAARIRGRDGLWGKPTPPARLHITLNGLGVHGAPPAGLIARANEAASQIRMRPFLVALNQVVSWKGSPRPLVLLGDEGVFGLYALHAAIHQALAEAGLRRRREPDFTPHLTLLRDFHETASEFVSPVRWMVRDFRLVDSLHGEGRHEVLGIWPLGA